MPDVLDSAAPAAPRADAAGRIVLVSAMRNEAPFVLEWVAYHLAIGVDQIVICANPSTDGTDALLAALAEAGAITYLPTNPGNGVAAQAEAVRAFESAVGYRTGDWYLWLDADEFLNVHAGDRTARALVSALGGATGVQLNWRLFGTSGHQTFPGRFVSGDFDRAARPRLAAHLETKSLFRYGPLIEGFAPNAIGRPRVRAGLQPKDFLAGTGEPLSPDPRTLQWLSGHYPSGRTNLAGWDELGFALAQINHYSVRTPEFFRLKARRGHAAVATGPRKPNARHTDVYFRRQDRNEAEDRSILHWDAATGDGIARLLALPGVAEAAAEAARQTAAELAAVADQPELAARSASPGPIPARVGFPSPASEVAPVDAVLVSAVKNEAPFLLEWIAYHKRLGFPRIVLISNESNDGTEELLAALAAAGEITHYRGRPRRHQSQQGVALAVFERFEGYRDGAWYLWLDADEFLNVQIGGRRLAHLVAAMGPQLGLNVNWRICGTSGHARFPGRFVSSAFTGASSLRLGANRGTKTIFRKVPEIVGFGDKAIYRPRLAEGHGLTPERFLAGNGQPLMVDSTVTQRWLAGDRTIRSNISTQGEAGWALAQINHFAVRTPEFFRLKALRGRGAGKLRLGNSRHTPEFFKAMNLNGFEDTSLADWEDEVSEEIARLRALPGVAAAAEMSALLVAEVLAAQEARGLAAQEAEGLAAQEAGGLADVVPGPTELAVEPIEPEETEPPPAAPTFRLTFPAAVAQLVRNAYAEASMILEYGSGGSTMLAANLGKPVISVESDRAWSQRLGTALAAISPTALVHHVDIGATGAWGKPRSSAGYAGYPAYALSVWDRPDLAEPDLVLIDGRFRAACLVAVMLRARRPTLVLFDDYVGRPYYHDVEKLARKDEVIGRMARFTVTPGPIPAEMTTQAISWFSDPR